MNDVLLVEKGRIRIERSFWRPDDYSVVFQQQGLGAMTLIELAILADCIDVVLARESSEQAEADSEVSRKWNSVEEETS